MTENFRPPRPELALTEMGWVQRLARSLVHDLHAAEDLAQETWLAAVLSKSPARTGSRAWLAGVARILARRRHRRLEPGAAGLLEEVSGPGRTPDEVLAQAEFQGRVLAAVTNLDEPYRATVLLRYFEGLSVEELSRRMGVPGSTGRTRLQRAHALLRDWLDREYGKRGSWSVLAGIGATQSVPCTLAEVGIMGTQLKIAIGFGLTAVVGLLTWKSLEDGSARSTEAGATQVVEPAPSVVVDVGPAPESSAADEDVRREVVAESAPTARDDEPDAAEDSVDANAMIERLKEALGRSAYGRIDPNAILDAALHLVELEPDDRAVPVPDVTGRLYFPILGVPDGVAADLSVAHSNRPEFAHVLGLDVKLTDANEPALFDGVPRQSPWVNLQIWGDPQGNLLHFGILTHFDADWSRMPGRRPTDPGTILEAVHYYLDLGDPAHTKLSGSGLRDGEHADWELPLALDGGPPRADAIERFGKRLIEMYAAIKAAR